MSKTAQVIKTLYLYLVALTAMVILLIASIKLLHVGIRYYVFDVTTPIHDVSPEFQCINKRIRVDGDNFRNLDQEEVEKCIENENNKQAERAKKETQNDIAWSLAGIIIALPVWLYHWMIIRRPE